MITINVMGDHINGSANNEQFGVPYTEEKHKAMVALQVKADKAETPKAYAAIVEEFQQLLVVDYTATIESECPNIHINKATGTYHLKSGEVVSSIPMPQALVDRVLESMDKKIDFEPLIKMWTRWLRNPILRKKTEEGYGEDFSNRMFEYINADYVDNDLAVSLMEDEGLGYELSIERATTKQVGITVEGLLRTFKVSREIHSKFTMDDKGDTSLVDRQQATSIDPDSGEITYDEISNEERLFEPAIMGTGGDAFDCGNTSGHFIKVGQAHRLSDWSKVDTDDHRSCVRGLHCGGLGYIKGYEYVNTETHNILVDPSNIGAVPMAGDGAIRVLEYYVLDAFSGINGAIYHSSTYAAQSDDKWVEDRKEAIEHFGELQGDLQVAKDELSAL